MFTSQEYYNLTYVKVGHSSTNYGFNSREQKLRAAAQRKNEQRRLKRLSLPTLRKGVRRFGMMKSPQKEAPGNNLVKRKNRPIKLGQSLILHSSHHAQNPCNHDEHSLGEELAPAAGVVEFATAAETNSHLAFDFEDLPLASTVLSL